MSVAYVLYHPVRKLFFSATDEETHELVVKLSHATLYDSAEEAEEDKENYVASFLEGFVPRPVVFSNGEIALDGYVQTLEGIIENGLPYGHGRDPVPKMLQPIIDFLHSLSNEEIAHE